MTISTKRRLAIFALSSGLATLSAGAALAQDAACTPGTTKKIAFMMKQQTAFRYLHSDMPFFVKAVEAEGYEVIVQSAENDAQVQVGQAENVITQGVDAIVINPVDFNVAAQIAEMANAAGVPIASYNDLITGADQDAYIGRDAREGGQIAAKAILAKVPKGNYALIGGDPGQTGATDMQTGYHDIIDPSVAKGDITIVMDQLAPGWKTEPAQAFAENALTQTNNDVDAFLVSYDGESIGVMQAVEGAGLPAGSIPITGQDMELAAMQAIVEGRMDGSVWPAPDEMGTAAGKVAVALAKCDKIEAGATIDNGVRQMPWVKTPIYYVDQSNIAEFVCTHDYWLPADEVYKNVPDKKPVCK
ncbi:MAG TPA: substrate-binding domain-containing protein [Devosia sp.]|nr:substrate-binding domain-containing protein [Devosia sp.]